MKHQFLFLSVFLVLGACLQTKKGDLNEFKEVNLESLSADNAPEGLVFRDDAWQPDKGWELVQSKDGNHVMLMQAGTDTGSAGYECKCKAGTGKCAVRKDIIMCIADECTDCSTVLKIYSNRVTINRANW